MSIIRLGLQSQDILVLSDRYESRVIEVFKVNDAGFKSLSISDSLGRLFKMDSFDYELWVHPLLLFKIPSDHESKLTPRGYVSVYPTYVEGSAKLHYLDFVKREKPELFKQVPIEFRKWG